MLHFQFLKFRFAELHIIYSFFYFHCCCLLLCKILMSFEFPVNMVVV